jgi:hypothetical protein
MQDSDWTSIIFCLFELGEFYFNELIIRSMIQPIHNSSTGMLYIDDSAINIIEELGELNELRRLWIKLEEWNDKLLECLHKLQKIQELCIDHAPSSSPQHRWIGYLGCPSTSP